MSLLEDDDALPQFVVDDKPARPWVKADASVRITGFHIGTAAFNFDRRPLLIQVTGYISRYLKPRKRAPISLKPLMLVQEDTHCASTMGRELLLLVGKGSVGNPFCEIKGSVSETRRVLSDT
ncbi:hypothetical protein CUC08_Gglean002108 [Alternaria sp. MG1]|nr:hypothetical protein CUC08_Gglean002108 [Alternaria sp. MG1]